MTKIDDMEKRRKRLKFRSQHRGIKELDLLLGRFALEHLDAMSIDQLDLFEALLDVPEPIIYDWLLGRVALPAAFDNDVTKLLLKYQFDPSSN